MLRSMISAKLHCFKHIPKFYAILIPLFFVVGCSKPTVQEIVENNFHELFYAIEIHSIYPVYLFLEDTLSKTEAIVTRQSSYWIQKYALWNPVQFEELMQAYLEHKDVVYGDLQQWHSVLKVAHDFELPNDWKKLLDSNDLEYDIMNFLSWIEPDWYHSILHLFDNSTVVQEKKQNVVDMLSQWVWEMQSYRRDDLLQLFFDKVQNQYYEMKDKRQEFFRVMAHFLFMMNHDFFKTSDKEYLHGAHVLMRSYKK